MHCPKCQALNADGSSTCIACGLIFARYDPQAQARVLAEHRMRRAAEREASDDARRAGWIIGAVVLLFAAAGIAWTLRTVPQQYSPPAGTTFSGFAHEYAGAGAELMLVGNEEPGVPVGRIEADGSFRFELPASMELPRIPPALVAQAAEFALADPAKGAEQRANLQLHFSTAESAVRRLGAGMGWSELEVLPRDMNVGRYGVVYQSPGERGDLFASNSDLKRVALPGEHMLVLVYADRAGSVRGVAQAMNAFGVEVPNAWELTLEPGWNLVISEQTANLGRLAYRTGPTPDDLEWYAIDPRTRAIELH